MFFIFVMYHLQFVYFGTFLTSLIYLKIYRNNIKKMILMLMCNYHKKCVCREYANSMIDHVGCLQEGPAKMASVRAAVAAGREWQYNNIL